MTTSSLTAPRFHHHPLPAPSALAIDDLVAPGDGDHARAAAEATTAACTVNTVEPA